ncbi:MAG: hypothetical protein IPF55_04555 [Rhodoferax sp.]|nr:hypothetical protein [Rhodoferax sp.]
MPTTPKKPAAKSATAPNKPVANKPLPTKKPEPKAAPPAQAALSKPPIPAKPSTSKATLPPKPVAAKQPVPKPAKPVKAKKPKLVRDSFTIPKAEYTVLVDLKARAAKLASPAKKSELLRAGVKALAAMSDVAFVAALKSVPTIKTGRPAKS